MRSVAGVNVFIHSAFSTNYGLTRAHLKFFSTPLHIEILSITSRLSLDDLTGEIEFGQKLGRASRAIRL